MLKGAGIPGLNTLSRFEPYPLLSGSAVSSHAPASWFFNAVQLPQPVALSHVNVFKSMNAAVPGATSENSSGTERYSYTHGLTVFTRQNYGTGSTNLSYLTTASFGLTGGMTYSSGSQTMALSWVTNTAGGTSSFSTSLENGGWSSYLTGPKMFRIPMITTLTAGEYWFAHRHSSTTGTTGSDVTLLSFSNLHIAPQLFTFGTVTSSAIFASGALAAGIGDGIASAVTTNNTMAGSVITASAVKNLWYMNLSNA